MSKVRRYLPPLVILLPLIFICGKLLLTAVNGHPRPYDANISPYLELLNEGETRWERGWPWIFQTTTTAVRFPGYVNLVQVDSDVDSVETFSIWLLLADLFCLIAIVAVAAYLLLRHYRRRGAWLRISLRELLALTTAVAVAAGWWMYHVNRSKNEVATLKQLSDYSIGVLGPNQLPDLSIGIVASGDKQYFGPAWIRRLVDNENLSHFYYTTNLIVGPVTAETWPALERSMAKLPHVRELVIKQSPMHVHDWNAFRGIESLSFEYATDGHLVGIEQLASLKELVLGYARLSAEGLRHVADCLRLEKLHLRGADVDRAAMEQLGRSRRLRFIDLSEADVDDTGVAHLASVNSLRELRLEGTQATDACFTALQKLPHLETLDWSGRPISDAGARQLLNFPSLETVELDSPPADLSAETLALLRAKIKHGNLGEAPYD
jgi:hypothetical protein